MTATTLAHPARTATPCAPALAKVTGALSITALATAHFLRIGGPATPRTIAASLDLPAVDVVAALTSLLDRGLVQSAGGDYVQTAT